MDLNYKSVTEHIISPSDEESVNNDTSDTEEASAIGYAHDTEDDNPPENYSPNAHMDGLSSLLSVSSAHLNWEASEPVSPITSDDEYYSPTTTKSYTIKKIIMYCTSDIITLISMLYQKLLWVSCIYLLWNTWFCVYFHWIISYIMYAFYDDYCFYV